MRRYHWVRLYALLLMIILFTTVFLAASKSALHLFREATRQRSIVRSVEGISDASSSIIKGVSSIAADAGREQYDQLLELVVVEDDSRLSERDLEGYFRLGYVNKIKNVLGSDGEQLCDRLNSFIAADGLSNVTVDAREDTALSEETDSDGNIISLRIKNVSITYDDPVTGKRTDTLSYSVMFPDAVFHAGNDDLFRYCLVARKGIYITGRTSSVIGDIFAGDHTAQECREAEIVYGETGTYGGINILSTQLGVKSDRILSMGDINLNGSFALFGPNLDSLKCFGSRINEIEGFSKKTDYTLDGKFIPIHKADEPSLEEYHEAIGLVDKSLAPLTTVTIYYDSDNDRTYTGKYRKLIAGTDVEISNDFTGIVVARSNVIIDRDVNFEGLILCGDRIYMRGNNNIVANPSVARAIIASESEGEYNIRIKDNIGGLRDAGLRAPDYYVIPYR